MRSIVPPPGVWIPDKTPHLPELEDAYRQYAAHLEWWNPGPPELETYRLLVKYVDVYSKGDPVWEFIVKPGRQGVSLLHHEAAELGWLLDRNLQAYQRNPFAPDYSRMLDEWETAHSLGLIAEHRYLEVLAKKQLCPFTLGELIKWNPIAVDSKMDLQILRSFLKKRGWHLVGSDELRIDERRKSAVHDSYLSLGFRGEYR